MPLAAGGTETVPVFLISSGASNGDYIIFASGRLDNYNFPITYDPTTLDDGAFPVCFCAGTAIATPDGETLVEDLAIGDRVTTQDGPPVPVK